MENILYTLTGAWFAMLGVALYQHSIEVGVVLVVIGIVIAWGWIVEDF